MAQLRKLIVEKCSKIEHIVGNEEEHKDDENRVEFPKLEYLEVREMHAFRSFYSAFDTEDKASYTLFNHQVIFPCLEQVCVYRMKKLRQVVDGQMLSSSLCKVRDMAVSSCENLLVVSASDTGSLQTLGVFDCQSLESVISFEGNQSTLGQLTDLFLSNLPKLVEIWRIPPPGNGTCQNLRCLTVDKCKNLRFLLPFHVSKMLVKIQHITIRECETMEGVIETDREEVDDDDAELALFPDLETLELGVLPMLEMFCSGSYIYKWPALRKLVILNCPKLKTCYETKRKISDAKSTEILETSNLNSYAASLFHQKVKFPNLKELDISDKVEILHDGVLVLRNLTKLNICNCDNVRYLFSPSIARELLSIQYLEINNCKLVEEIVVRDVEDDEKIDKLVLPGLKELVLQKLENLKWFFHGNLDFPSLEYFQCHECPKMEVLCCGTLCTPKIVDDLNDTIRFQYSLLSS